MGKSYIKVDSSEHGTESTSIFNMAELDLIWKTSCNGDKRFIHT